MTEVIERERGTLSKTLPRRTEVIFALVNCAATGAAVLCCHSLVTTRKDWACLVAGSALSSLATIGGIVYADSAIHSLFLGLAIFATYVINGIASGTPTAETLSVSLSLSRVLFGVAIASRLPVIKRMLVAMFSTSIILNPIMISSLCCLPLISFLMGSSMLLAENTMQQVKLPVLSPAMLVLATLCLSGLYYCNRSNKHGNLILQKEQQGMIVVTSLAFAWTAQHASQIHDVHVFLPILVGSAVTSLLSLTFASVADVWDAVGSGQFQMISLDTAALIGYVGVPLLVLASIASRKYGDSVIQAVGEMLRLFISDEFIQQQERSPEQAMTSGLYLLFALATTVGVSVVNMLSPIAPYLFTKAYMSGQPRTNRIALLIHFKDFLDNESEEKTDAAMDFLITANKAVSKPVLNIFVTAHELRLFPDMICKLRSAGHAFGICSTCVNGILEAYEAYVEVLKVVPEWYHVGRGTTSRGPDAMKLATDLNLKVAFWSTHIGVTSQETFRKKHLPSLRQDVATTRGGSFVYLTNDWQDTHVMIAAIEGIVKDLSASSRDIQYSFSALSNVAKEDSRMIL